MESPTTIKFIPNTKGWIIIAAAAVLLAVLAWWMARRRRQNELLEIQKAAEKVEKSNNLLTQTLNSVKESIAGFGEPQKEEPTSVVQEVQYPEIVFPAMMPFSIEISGNKLRAVNKAKKMYVEITHDQQGTFGEFRQKHNISHPAFVFRLYKDGDNAFVETYLPTDQAMPEPKRFADEIKMLFLSQSPVPISSPLSPADNEDDDQ